MSSKPREKGIGGRMDRFQCAECEQIFYLDMEIEGMMAEPGEKLPLACPHCGHSWSFYRPEETVKEM
ncbi:MAG: hypothetical protein ACLFVT_07750 [Syntrophobacteria bacterium]